MIGKSDYKKFEINLDIFDIVKGMVCVSACIATTVRNDEIGIRSYRQ